MSIRFSEDVIPLADLKINPGRVVRHTGDVHRPALITSRGRGVAVLQSVSAFEKSEEERAFMRAVIEGFTDLDSGREISLADARAQFELG